MSTARGTPFPQLCRAMGLPAPTPEYLFALHLGRHWRFDFAWVPQRIALELDGGLWRIGRHQRRDGFIEDLRKRNTALLEGWLVFTLPTEEATHVTTFELLRKALALRP